MLDKLGQSIKRTTDKIANALFLDKNLVQTILKDLQRALIEADVNILLVKELSDKIKKAAFDERIKEVEKKEHLIKVLHDELRAILGEERELTLRKEQTKIMLLGLYGAGKTTTIAKLANYYQKRGKKTAIVGLDVHRPAAREQLEQLGRKNNLTVFIDKKEYNAKKIWQSFEKELKKYEVILVDTAGRHNLDEELITEIEELNTTIKPQEKILVLPADVGQTARSQAEKFESAVKITGVIITRMDSTAKGGGALTACAEAKVPVYFIATGEKMNDLEKFNPEQFLSRLLGMGDLKGLLEKVRLATDDQKQANLQKNLEEGKLTLDDVIEQVKTMNEIGGFDKLKGMIPGMSAAKISDEQLGEQQAKIARWEHIVKSMTKKERENPEMIEKETKRMGRIARGAGVNTSDVRALMKQYRMLKDMIKESSSFDPEKGMSQRQMQKMMRKFAKGKKMRL